MATKIMTAALSGLDAALVAVEADAGGGDFGRITIVGLPDKAISEARERVRSALRNCGRPYPRRRITINLAPADLKKYGPAYDLPMAISVLALQNKFSFSLAKSLFVGELSLDGQVRPVRGILAITMATRAAGLDNLFVPRDNVAEAGIIKGLKIFPVTDLKEIIDHLRGQKQITSWQGTAQSDANHKDSPPTADSTEPITDMADIAGQEKAKRALEIAAAGEHNLLLFGSPGAGKTMLARAIQGILPPLNLSEQLEVTKIYSITGKNGQFPALISRRPFRSPHHSSSAAALIGGGLGLQPGEISLAHRGVLFLDEFPEFSRDAIESLRQPLEEGFINLSRAGIQARLPASFILLAAMNPCPCGYAGDHEKICRCSPSQVANYRRRLSGPILDRIDMQVEMPRPDWDKLELTSAENRLTNGKSTNGDSRFFQERVVAVRQTKAKRSTGQSSASQILFCPAESENFLFAAARRWQLSHRARLKIIALARTIADLAGEENITPEHIAEALQYRSRPTLE